MERLQYIGKMHVKEIANPSSSGDGELKETVEESSISSTTPVSLITTPSSSFTSTNVGSTLSFTDSVGVLQSEAESAHLSQSSADSVILTQNSLESVNLTQSHTEFVNSRQSHPESVNSTQSHTDSVNLSHSCTDSVNTTQSNTECTQSSGDFVNCPQMLSDDNVQRVVDSVSAATSVSNLSSSEDVPDSISVPPNSTECVRFMQSRSDSVSPVHSVTNSLAHTRTEPDNCVQSSIESVRLPQIVSNSVGFLQNVNNNNNSLTRSVSESVVSSSNTSNAKRDGLTVPVLNSSLDSVTASDSAVETDDSCHEDMLIDSKDIKQEVNSDCEDTVDGNVLHRLSNLELKFELDTNSNSSCSLNGFGSNLWNAESDASMRQRLFTSLSQSFPGSALSRVLHSMDTMPLDSEDEDLIPTPERLSSSCFSSIRLEKEDDDELTSLAWLQDSDLLKNINAGEEDIDATSEEQKENADGQKNGVSGGGGFVPQAHPCDIPYNPMKHVNSKPPFSFSCLIFMAVENSPSKKLPVKEIYHWILTNFPYFQNAPTGWKNSVRHNLSLNKCFKKVEKDKGANIGKGSLWCIDPEFRPNLLQALRKTPYHPYQQLQMMSSMVPHTQVHHIQGLPSGFRAMPLTQRAVPNTVSPHLFPFLSRRLAQTGVDRDTQDVANVLLAMSSKNSSGMSSDGSDASGPTSPRSKMKRKINGPPKRQGPFIVTAYPSEDHCYSSPKILEEDAASGTSSIDNEYDFGDDNDISEPSDYPSDWDESSGDEVDGDIPEVQPSKRLRIDLKPKKEVKAEKDEDLGAKLLMSFAGLADYSDEEDKGGAKKSSSSCSKPRSSSKSARPSSVSPKSRTSSSAAASRSTSSLSSSHSSTSSSRSSPTKPISRSGLSSKLLTKTKLLSKASTKSSNSLASTKSKTSKSGASGSKWTLGKSARSASPSSSKKTESSSPAKPSFSTTPSSKPLPSTPSPPKSVSSSPGSSVPSSTSSTSSATKSSIIMTRRGKAAAAAAAKSAAKAAAEAKAIANRMCTRGKKLSFS